MMTLTVRFFYGIDEARSLYIYTLHLNSNFLSAAFVETINIVSFLQTAKCDILDINLIECPIL